MSAILVISILLAYFLLLIGISHFTTINNNSSSFFTGDKRSPWYLVAFGMTGASLSGVTFISVPGETANTGWSYLIFVIGNAVGYLIISKVLLPVYYKLKLVSIYTYLEGRFGKKTYKTGSCFFIISQTIGASFRLFLVTSVLQLAFFDVYNIPFGITVLIIIFMIWIYTFKGGIRTIVFTDTIQTIFMLSALAVTIITISQQLDLNFGEISNKIWLNPKSKILDVDWSSSHFWLKHFFAGIAITIVMNGLDQNMMQKNLSCRNIKESQKNMKFFTLSFVLTNFLFLCLGVLLYLYAKSKGIELPNKTDEVFAFLALNHFGTIASIFFLLGITAAAYSSVDSALTALTTSFCIDLLEIDIKDKSKKKIKTRTHIAFSIIMFLVIILFREINNDSVVSSILTIAGYTYGPLLGLYAFGLFTKHKIIDKYTPIVCIVSPILCYIINIYSVQWFGGYKFGFELLILNGIITFVGLLITKNNNQDNEANNITDNTSNTKPIFFCSKISH
ncbi:MAG: sodium:solute symporter [Marinifilaceae bacterium]